MTALVFWGCLLTAFGPALSMLVVTVVTYPLRVILLIVGAFFWLLSLLLTSLIWLAVVPLQEEAAFGLFVGVAFQEAFRFGMYKLLRKAEAGLQDSLSEEERASIARHLLPYITGLGFGLMSGCFSILNIISLSHGPGNVGINGGSGNFFLVSALLTNAFILLNTFWTIIFFDGLKKKKYLSVFLIISCHFLLSGLTLLNADGIDILYIPYAFCIGIYYSLNMQSVFFTAALIAVHSFSSATDVAKEALTVKVTNRAQLYSVFNFSLISSYNTGAEGYHYHLFPRNIGNLVKKYNVAEFHLSMTQGLWRYESWGYPYFPAPPGAQLWVWFHQNVKDINAAWRGFANALSGLLCASLNFIGKTETVSPHLSFKPEGYLSGDDRRFIRYAVLPRENLCTENLTPWLKLLPCGSSAGISRLLEPATLHHSRYLSLGLDFKYTCEEFSCARKRMELFQSVSTVFDLQVGSKGRPDFSLEDVLSRRLKGACPLASSSLIKFVVPQPVPTYSDGGFKVYDLLNVSKPGNIKAKWPDASSISVQENPNVLAHCHITGVGHQDGGIQCQITNTASKDISSIVMQTVPWFLQVYLHTFKITNEVGKQMTAENLTFRPAKIRESPHFIEYQIKVPAKSTLTISMQFTRGFLTWTEHPPDANHGFYIGSTVLSVNGRDIDLDHDDTHRIYSEIIQVIIPVPDFSMPYNVICLACTVVAIAFGSLHNLTTRTYQKVDPDDDKKGLVSRIKDMVLLVKTRLTGKPKAE